MTTTKAAQHTAGPWKFVDIRHQQNGQIRIWPDSESTLPSSYQQIANVLASNYDCVANARLIAAAPEMLEALDKIHILASFDGEPISKERLSGIAQIACAAIQKARGEK